MAYNNGFPMNFQQGYYPQVNNPTPQVQQVNNGIIWVQGEASAKSYPVAPNTSVPLWDSEANVIYIKSADMSGMPSIKVLDYTIRDGQPKPTEKDNSVKFATLEDFDRLKNEFKSLKSEFNKMNKEKSNGKRLV